MEALKHLTIAALFTLLRHNLDRGEIAAVKHGRMDEAATRATEIKAIAEELEQRCAKKEG